MSNKTNTGDGYGWFTITGGNSSIGVSPCYTYSSIGTTNVSGVYPTTTTIPSNHTWNTTTSWPSYDTKTEVKGLYLLFKIKKEEKEWCCSDIILMSDKGGSYLINKDGNIIEVTSYSFYNCVVVNKETLEKAKAKGVLIKDNFPSILLTPEEEMLKEVIE